MDFRNVSLWWALEARQTSELALKYLQVKHAHSDDVLPMDLESRHFLWTVREPYLNRANKYATRIRGFVYPLNTRDFNKESRIQNRVDDLTGLRYNSFMARLG